MDWWGANVYVDFAWGDAPLTADASCTWVDETAYVRRVGTNRGRTSELSAVGPGTMSVSLDNSSRRFDPANTAGAHYGELLPMTKVRFRAGAGSTLVVFSGFVLGWPQSYPGMTDKVVQVQCVDAMRVLEQSETPGSAYGAAVLADSPTHYWPMQSLDDAGEVKDIIADADMSQRLYGDPVTTTAAYPVGESAALADSSLGAPNSDAALPATIEWWRTADTTDDQQVRVSLNSTNIIGMNLNSGASGVVVWYSNSTSNLRADTSYTKTLADTSINERAQHIAMTVSGSTLSVYVNGVLNEAIALSAGTGTTPTPTGNQPGFNLFWGATSSRSHFATYSSALSAARILAHYQAGSIAHGHPMGERTGERIGRILDAVGWPAADRAISTGSTVCGTWEPAGGNALSQIRALESLEQGLFYIAADGKATFRDRNWLRVNARAITARYTYGDGGGSEIAYGDIEVDGNHLEHVRNTVTASYPGSSVTVKDATSRAAYGIQSDSVDATDLPTWGGWLARQAANYRLRTRKDPKTRIPSLVVDPRGAGALATTLPAVVDLDLGDRVTVIRRPNGSTDPISVNCHVQGIRHDVTPATWRTTLYLAPAVPSYTEGNNLLVGDATYGIVGDGHLTAY